VRYSGALNARGIPPKRTFKRVFQVKKLMPIAVIKREIWEHPSKVYMPFYQSKFQQ